MPISAPVTSDAIARHLATAKRLRPGARTTGLLEEMGDVLRTFGSARYGRSAPIDSAALDLALENGARLVRQLRFSQFLRRPPVRAVARLALRN
jgi:hypothetical protein